MITKWIWLLYLTIVFPYLLGLLHHILREKNEIRILDVLLIGKGWQLSIFWLLALPAAYLHWQFSMMVRVWCVTSLLLGFVSLVIVRYDLLEPLGSAIDYWVFSKETEQKIRTVVFVLFLAFVMALSIGYVRPMLEDATVEKVLLMRTTDYVYQIRPYTMEGYENPGINFSPIELYYGVESALIDMNFTRYVHVLVPLVFYPFIGILFFKMSELLFPDMDFPVTKSKHKKFRVIRTQLQRESYRFYFCMGMLLFPMVELFHEGNLALAFYRNIWNGKTLCFSVFLPAAAIFCVASLRKQWVNQDLRWKSNGTEKHREGKIIYLHDHSYWFDSQLDRNKEGIGILLLMMCAQLSNQHGGLMVMLGGFIVLVLVAMREGVHHVETTRLSATDETDLS